MNKSFFNKSLIVIFLILCCIIGTLYPAFAFFSDAITNIEYLSTSNVLLDLSDLELEYGVTNINDANNTLVQTNIFNIDEIYSFGFTLKNLSKSALKINSILKIAWDNSSFDLPESNCIYLYSNSMTDEEIKYDLENNNASSALINMNSNDKFNLTMNDNSTRLGFEYSLSDLYLDSSLPNGDTNSLSNGISSKTYNFKVVFAIIPNNGQKILDFEMHKNQNLKIDIESNATTTNFSLWKNQKTATVVLNNAIINNTSDVVNNYEYTGDIQTFTAPYTGTYKLEVWGAERW